MNPGGDGLRLDGVVRLDGFDVELTLEVARGEAVALVGPNGAGKSTVLRTIAGLAPLATGRLTAGGSIWDDPSVGRFVPPRRRSAGVMFQQYLLFEHLTALENVAFGLRARRIAARAARRRAGELLELLGLGDVADRRPRQLSGGQAQRVALARALATDGDVLLLDEPLAALDVAAKADVRRDLVAGLRDIGREDSCRVIVTHDPVDAHQLADRIVVLEHGRVTQTGTFEQLAAAPRSTYAAELMGTNVLAGRLTGSTFESPGRLTLTVGAHDLRDGPALVAIRPMAVALHRARPEGSPRNVWRTTLHEIDRYHERVRVRLGPELPLVVEITEAGLAALGLLTGDHVWASVKASEITVTPDA